MNKIESYCYQKYKSPSNNSCVIKEKNIVGKNLLEGTYFDGNDIPKMIGITKAEYLEYKKLQQENKQLQKQITVMKEYLGLITDLSFDYDGCNTVESLKSLIDDLKRYAKLGGDGNLTESIYTDDNDSYNILHQKIRKDSTNE